MSSLNIIFIILLLSLIICAVIAVMVRNLLKAAIALAVTSAVLTVVMFLMGAPLAAVFELSVCAGLITVVFVSAISMTKPGTPEELIAKVKARMKRFIYLPFILLIVAGGLWFALPYMNINWVTNTFGPDLGVKETLWNTRQLDILGQIIAILAGVFGVVVLFKEREAK